MPFCGAGGHGKSAVAKLWLHRTGIVHGDRRLVCVIDPKGEWAPLAARLGWHTLTPGADTGVDPLAEHPGLLTTLVTIATGRDLDVGEHRILTQIADAVRTARHATLDTLRRRLANPTVRDAATLDTTPAELRDRDRPLGDALARLTTGTTSGLFATRPGVPVDWDTVAGVVIDCSRLLTDPFARRVALAVVTAWLHHTLTTRTRRPRCIVVDEAWLLLADPHTVHWLQATWRLGRQFGIGNVLITHALADLADHHDTGTTAAKITTALLHTTPTRVFLHQNTDRARELATTAGLDDHDTTLLHHLPPGHALWQYGGTTRHVHHLAHPHETDLIDTNRAFG